MAGRSIFPHHLLLRAMRHRQPLDYFVLDALSFDEEQFDQIVAYLNDAESEWRHRYERVVQRPEVLASLMRLVKDGLVVVQLDEHIAEGTDPREGVWPDKPLTEMYFNITGRGEVLYLNWDY